MIRGHKIGAAPTHFFVEYEPVGAWYRELSRVGGVGDAVDMRRVLTRQDYTDFLAAQKFTRHHELYAAVWTRFDITHERSADGLIVWEWTEEICWEQGGA